MEVSYLLLLPQTLKVRVASAVALTRLTPLLAKEDSHRWQIKGISSFFRKLMRDSSIAWIKVKLRSSS
jgi:hypothetical protein